MLKVLANKGGLVVDRPGNVLFIPVKADETLDHSGSIVNTAKINTITITNTRTKTTIPDGNNLYPAGDRVTDIAGSVAIEFSTIDPRIWAMASGSEIMNTQKDAMLKIFEYQKVGEDGILKIPGKYKENGFVSIIGSDGTEYEKVSADAAAAGEYSISTQENETTITFSTEDAGKNVRVVITLEVNTYSYSQGVNTMTNHKLIIATDYSTLNNAQKVPVNIEVSQVSLGADLVDALQKDPSATKTLTFNMYAPLPGEEPYKVKFEEITE